MSSTTSPAPRVRLILYEGPGAKPLDDDRRTEVLTSLLEAGHSIACPSDSGSVAPEDDTTHLVIGEFEGEAPTFTSPKGDVSSVSMSGTVAAELPAAIDTASDAVGSPTPQAWKPWFPVIDYDRCTNCMQCLTFCLFDVYGVDGEAKIQVQNHQKCKTDCPACSRVCPEAAILFPKYKAGPINGAPVTEDDVKKQAMKVDISALLGGDIYSELKNRSKTARERFSTERDESKALLERKRCLKKLQKDLDIPPEVLMTLPSVEDIESRALRAKEKAKLREGRSQTIKDEQEKRTPPTPDDWGI